MAPSVPTSAVSCSQCDARSPGPWKASHRRRWRRRARSRWRPRATARPCRRSRRHSQPAAARNARHDTAFAGWASSPAGCPRSRRRRGAQRPRGSSPWDRTRPTVEADSVTCGDGLNRPLTSRNEVPPVHGRFPRPPGVSCPKRVPGCPGVVAYQFDSAHVRRALGPHAAEALSRTEVCGAAPGSAEPSRHPTQR